MHENFRFLTERLDDRFELLLSMHPTTVAGRPRMMPKKGIYLLTEGNRHLYVGRSRNISSRLANHSRPSARENQAAFAFRLARESTGLTSASYQEEGSRKSLMQSSVFVDAFTAAKARIRAMDLRYVEEAHPVRQALLEIYVAVVLGTPYNDFDTH